MPEDSPSWRSYFGRPTTKKDLFGGARRAGGALQLRTPATVGFGYAGGVVRDLVMMEGRRGGDVGETERDPPGATAHAGQTKRGPYCS